MVGWCVWRVACVWRVCGVWLLGCGVWGVVGGRVGYAKAWPRRGGERREAPQLSLVVRSCRQVAAVDNFPRLVSRPAFFRSTLPCSAAPVSIRRPRSRVPRLGTRLGGLRLAVLRCVRPHCRAGVVPVHRPTARKMIQVVLAMTWSTNANNLTRYWDSKLLLDLTKLVGEAYLS